MGRWQLQEAKNRFSELVDRALAEGPQVVTRRGTETVVILSVREYEKLARRDEDLVGFFQASPMRGVELDLERDQELGREVEF